MGDMSSSDHFHNHYECMYILSARVPTYRYYWGRAITTDNGNLFFFDTPQKINAVSGGVRIKIVVERGGKM